MAFRTWRPGEPLTRGVWGIPTPEQGVEAVPNILSAPVVGVDRDRLRLGYAGGYFDRTLSALPVKPLTIGIGYEISATTTIYPLPHDVPIDRIVTEDPIYGCGLAARRRSASTT